MKPKNENVSLYTKYHNNKTIILYKFMILETIQAGKYLYELNWSITHNAHINHIIHMTQKVCKSIQEKSEKNNNGNIIILNNIDLYKATGNHQYFLEYHA